MLLNLPPELILKIHLHALNPSFPSTHPQIHSILTRPTPSFAATYLLSLYETNGPSDILTRSLRHPICNTDVAQELRRMWDRRRGHSPLKAWGASTRSRSNPADGPDDREATSDPTAPPLTCSELPRRIFRSPLPEANPLLHYLFDHYSPSPNSHKGYPLCRAVLNSDYALIDFLLRHGADPALKSNLVLEIAIKKNDLKAVRMLIERKSEDVPFDDVSGTEHGRDRGRKKRRKLSDRVSITPRLVQIALQCGSQDIVHYFVEDKGVIPPLHGILAMSSPTKPVRLGRVRPFGSPRYA
ncbi:hypothetical protein BD324DRAFT_600855 [Kockovaella imperatae]|uniref:Ankyrin repeat-containing domain protein n=1 Tax=Kockovaella imperatae TaxID=4999 RepID=A0A1Y1UGJ3_9TREE|nr:hypothetical protein BD324DRAFT_600855 [Kockovaella imperatae]ORX37180.1 hypothetical protein BD324DRAFT_600855 [Kockovaella imperatae]